MIPRSPEATRAFLVEAAALAKPLSVADGWRSARALGTEWLAIALAVGATVVVDHPVVWALAAVLVATRQHGLLILVHEATHWRLTSHRSTNDAVANLLAGWPLGMSIERFRNGHLNHHAHVGTPRDPDWPLRHGRPDWDYPKTGAQLVRMYLRQLLGEGVVNG